jgi:hypothetical protein
VHKTVTVGLVPRTVHSVSTVSVCKTSHVLFPQELVPLGGGPCDVSGHAKQIQIDIVFIHFCWISVDVDVRHEVTIAVVACASVALWPFRLFDRATVWKV